MTVTITPEQAPATELELEFDHGLNRYVLHDYVGTFKEAHAGPQGFLVEFKTSNGAIRPHYHEVDQYQVVVGGSGAMGNHELVPGVIHYADCFSPYGPIHSGPDGIAFFTLRLTGVQGSNYMPDSRDKERPRPGHQFEALADVSLPSSGQQVRGLASSPDGAEAFELRAGPGEPLPSPGRAALAKPAYYVLLAGELEESGQALPERTCVLHEAGEPQLDATAGPVGAVVAYLAFRTDGQPEQYGTPSVT